MNIEKRSSQMAWRFKLGLTCSVLGAAWAASACGADVGRAADSTDLAEEALWSGQADSDSRETRARRAFWAYWRHVLRHQDRDHDADPPSCREDSKDDRGEACGDGYPEPDDRSPPDDDESNSDGDQSPRDDDQSPPPRPAPDARSNSGDRPTPGDERTSYVQCGASLSCGPTTGGCCAMSLECASANRQCSTSGPIFNCDGPEDCTRPGERCWGGIVAPICASVGPFLKCHTDADCDLARPVCNSAGNCVN